MLGMRLGQGTPWSLGAVLSGLLLATHSASVPAAAEVSSCSAAKISGTLSLRLAAALVVEGWSFLQCRGSNLCLVQLHQEKSAAAGAKFAVACSTACL